eukprot:gene8109-1551_t
MRLAMLRHTETSADEALHVMPRWTTPLGVRKVMMALTAGDAEARCPASVTAAMTASSSGDGTTKPALSFPGSALCGADTCRAVPGRGLALLALAGSREAMDMIDFVSIDLEMDLHAGTDLPGTRENRVMTILYDLHHEAGAACDASSRGPLQKHRQRIEMPQTPI